MIAEEGMDRPTKQKYVALRRLGGDGEVWLPGSIIELDDIRARILLEKQAVAPWTDTKPPAPLPPDVIVHQPIYPTAGQSEGG